jgi:hypothetical protein
MRPNARFLVIVAAVIAAASLTMAAPAVAAIKCQGNYQVVQGRLLATPYCQDGYLAQIAREYGFHETAHEMRWNPSKKQQVCEAIGQDNRVFEACIGYRRDFGNRYWLP